MSTGLWILAGVGALLGLVVIHDLLQRKHAILRNFPIVGHFRFILESVGPELRQYIVTGNDEERPFSRDERRWVYASAKKQNNYFGFGTDNDLELEPHHIIIKHAAFPARAPSGAPDYRVPCTKILGGPRGRAKAFRMDSVVNVSAMSFGSLSARAIEAINRGVALAGCLHNTGEGGVSPYHQNGGDLIWQVGTGYFGCRDARGNFSMELLEETVARTKVRAIEIKLSQGAKPGMGGLLPAAKITREISGIRGIPMGDDCHSPAYHTAFSDPDSLLDFVESIAQRTGLPVGIKSAVGEIEFWRELGRLMATTDRGVDYIQVDGGEGGTGAAPLVFSDHVALPFKIAFTRVYRELAEHGMTDDVVFIGSGKLGFPEAAVLAFALGCDAIAVAREAMLSIGCIQAQRCHTGRCPTGVATQGDWLMHGLDPTDKAARLANYVKALRKELIELSHACGVLHPALITADRLEVIDDRFSGRSLADVFAYPAGIGQLTAARRAEIEQLMRD